MYTETRPLLTDECECLVKISISDCPHKVHVGITAKGETVGRNWQSRARAHFHSHVTCIRSQEEAMQTVGCVMYVDWFAEGRVTYLCLCSRLPCVVQKLVEKLHWRKGWAAACELYSSSLLQSHSLTSHCPYRIYRSYMSFWKGTAIMVAGILIHLSQSILDPFFRNLMTSLKFPQVTSAVGGNKWVQCLNQSINYSLINSTYSYFIKTFIKTYLQVFQKRFSTQ